MGFSASSGLAGVALEVNGSQLGQVETVSSSVALEAVSCYGAGDCEAAGVGGVASGPASAGNGVLVPIANGAPGSATSIPGVLFAGVACSSSSSCAAVGAEPLPSGGSEGAVVSVSGGTAGSPELVSGAAALNSVACSSATSCEAAGYVSGASGSAEGVLVALSSGTPGSPLDVAETSALLGISCASSTCEASGVDLTGPTSSNGVVVAISGGLPASPQGVPASSGLDAISCTSSTLCEAVGNDPAGNPQVLQVRGGAPGSPVLAWFGPGLYGVSCSASACEAAGSSGQSASLSALTSGSAGAPVVVPGAIALVAVSCPATGSCEAVGLSAGGEGVVLGVSGGTAGSPVAVPGTSELTSVSCVSVGNCVAVGSSAGGEGVVVAISNGTPGAASAVAGTSGLTGVSCASASTCEAVGYEIASGGSPGGVALTVTGGTPGSVVALSGTSVLNGISCASASTCEAVGGEITSSGSGSSASAPAEGVVVSLASGSPGSAQAVAGAFSLYAVSCATSGSCEATGSSESGAYSVVVGVSGGVPGSMIGTWAAVLQGLSCASTTTCVLVGSDQAGQGVALATSSGVPLDTLYSASMPIGLAVDDPASQPFVTAVGGTSLTSLGPPPVQSAWNNGVASGGGAGGGGISSIWQMPSWQKGTGVVNQYSSGSPCGAPSGSYCREVPDVSASADPNHGDVIYYQGAWQVIGGTSEAAPLWAALVAVANEGCSSSTGFANPALYAHASDLQGVTMGNNDYTGTNGGLYPATAGYNLATGLGTPTAAIFAPGALCPAPLAEPSASGLTVVPADNTTGATTTYQVSFTTSSKGALAAPASIYLTMTAGTTMPASSADYAVSDVVGGSDKVSSVTVSAAGGSATPNEVAISLSASSITANDGVAITISGVANPSLASPDDTATATTSADTVVLTSAPYAIVAPPVVAGTYVPMSPARIVDTRCSESPLPASLSASYCAALPTANASLSSPAGAKKIHVQVTGVGGVPDTGVAAVLVNLTFAGSFATGGYLSAYPTGSGATTGEFSNLNWSPATYQGAVANLAVVEVGAGGDITIYNGSASFT
ncbi:MAG: hypothetical protein ACYCUF_11895, partial [Acidimicrobiales bacterium]